MASSASAAESGTSHLKDKAIQQSSKESGDIAIWKLNQVVFIDDVQRLTPTGRVMQVHVNVILFFCLVCEPLTVALN